MSSGRVLGVDACKAGWLGVVLSDGGPSFHFTPQIGDLLDRASMDGSPDAVAIDIPIGLPDASRRQADGLARKVIGPRWASVFITPVRAALRRGATGQATTPPRARPGRRSALALGSLLQLGASSKLRPQPVTARPAA
jgi:predicted RNase H-like nuclease